MNKITSPTVLDADCAPMSDEDQLHKELKSAYDLAVRRQRAYDYLSEVDDRIRTKALRMVQAASIIFLLAVVAALLIG